MLSFGGLLGLEVFLGLKLPNFGTAVSLPFAIVTVSLEVSGECSHFVGGFEDADGGGSELGSLHSTL